MVGTLWAASVEHDHEKAPHQSCDATAVSATWRRGFAERPLSAATHRHISIRRHSRSIIGKQALRRKPSYSSVAFSIRS